MEHTKGTWVVSKIGSMMLSINTGRKHIALTGYWHSGDNNIDVSKDEAEANARLIAAAPQLLKACKLGEATANTAIHATPTGGFREALTCVNILRLEAIAKATKGE